MCFEETEILKMMKNLDLTREEAIQLLIDDKNDVSAEITTEQQKVVKKMARADSTPRKGGSTRKPNEKRRCIMKELEKFLSENGYTNVTITNAERELTFVQGEDTYRLTLAKPRKGE